MRIFRTAIIALLLASTAISAADTPLKCLQSKINVDAVKRPEYFRDIN